LTDMAGERKSAAALARATPRSACVAAWARTSCFSARCSSEISACIASGDRRRVTLQGPGCLFLCKEG
jgi:hypothetical protein